MPSPFEVCAERGDREHFPISDRQPFRLPSTAEAQTAVPLIPVREFEMENLDVSAIGHQE